MIYNKRYKSDTYYLYYPELFNSEMEGTTNSPIHTIEEINYKRSEKDGQQPVTDVVIFHDQEYISRVDLVYQQEQVVSLKVTTNTNTTYEHHINYIGTGDKVYTFFNGWDTAVLALQGFSFGKQKVSGLNVLHANLSDFSYN